jgi:hypothetical protein
MNFHIPVKILGAIKFIKNVTRKFLMNSKNVNFPSSSPINPAPRAALRPFIPLLIPGIKLVNKFNEYPIPSNGVP